MDLEHKRKPVEWGCLAWPFFLALTWISFAGWARLVLGVRDWYWYTRYEVQPGPGYLALSGALWGVGGLAAMVWVWLRLRRYPQVGMGAVVGVAVTYWLDRLVLSRPEGGLVSLPFGAAVTVLALGYAFVLLRPGRGAARDG